ncbi:TlpA family protein disulfide reductase [Puniceicoccaceae bacterium K14]|nr:TlpA family protein disulfide reductase [Puniceicoccaceae bacterium K14]
MATIILTGLLLGYIVMSVGSNNCAMCTLGEMFTGSSSDKSGSNETLELAGNWEANDLNGNFLSAESTKGKVSIVVYWATWCAPCRKEFPILNTLRNEFSNEQLEIIGVSVDMPGKDLKPFVADHKLNYTIVHNNDTLENSFGPVKYIPTVFVIDSNGVIKHRHTGNVSKEILQAQVNNLLRSSV